MATILELSEDKDGLTIMGEISVIKDMDLSYLSDMEEITQRLQDGHREYCFTENTYFHSNGNALIIRLDAGASLRYLLGLHLLKHGWKLAGVATGPEFKVVEKWIR